MNGNTSADLRLEHFHSRCTVNTWRGAAIRAATVIERRVFDQGGRYDPYIIALAKRNGEKRPICRLSQQGTVWWVITLVAASALSLSFGCQWNDPNYNRKMQYDRALKHARRFLSDSGAKIDCHHPNYDLMIFNRDYYDEKTKVFHMYTLYDFLKTVEDPGPDRFIIAYDRHDRRTYLRDDLRSNDDLEDWDEFRQQMRANAE